MSETHESHETFTTMSAPGCAQARLLRFAPMSSRDGYHGGFEHPRRAFLAGILLLGLLFGGFALGIDLGRRPAATAALPAPRVEYRTIDHRVVKVEQVTVALPATTEVISGRTVTVPGATRTRRIWVQVPETGPAAPVIGVIRRLMAADTALENGTTGLAPPPVTVVQPVTETQTQTVTETETVTVTQAGGGTTTTGGGATGP